MTADWTEPNRQIAQSWETNAEAWTRVIRSGGIESRRLVTDAAILAAAAAHSPRRVLDVGCGEGWLCRALAEAGWEVVGIDSSAGLIEAARAAGGGRYLQLSYDDFATQPERLGAGPFDVIVCNFSLLQEDLAPLLRALSTVLASGGELLIQTVHPWTAQGDGRYADGWRVERFEQFGGEFRQAMPWFFRTLSSWIEVLRVAGFSIRRVLEPAHPQTGAPASLLISAGR